MKIGLVVIILLTCTRVATAQGKYDANWCFGYHAGINFSDSSNPTTFLTACNNLEACSSISDSEGNLLFYLSSGPNLVYALGAIRDKNNDIITNGDSILINPNATNGSLILPVKGCEYIFQIYSTSQYDVNYKLLFSKVKNIGDSVFIEKKNWVLSDEIIEEKLAAVRHANGRDWWVVVHQTTNDSINICNTRFFIYLVTPDTILGPDFQDIGSTHCIEQDLVGQMLFSQDGNELVEAVWGEQEVDLFSFDRCTGRLSNYRPVTLPSGLSPYGCALSPNKQFLYVSSGFIAENDTLDQFELDTSGNTLNKYSLFSAADSNDLYLGQLRLAPNGKIYLSAMDDSGITMFSFRSQHLSVINAPDSLGNACNFSSFSFYLGDSSRTFIGLPNMPNYNLAPLNSVWASTISKDTFICTNRDTPTKGVFISVDTAPGVMVTWQSAPGIENINATRQLVNPTQSMWYYVTFTDTSLQGTCTSRMDSVFVAVEVCTEGIQNVTQSNQRLTIYPNPAQNIATMKWQPVGEHDCSLAIYDLLGREITDQKVDGTGKALLNISDLSNGMYVVKLYMGNEVAMSGKLVVVR